MTPVSWTLILLFGGGITGDMEAIVRLPSEAACERAAALAEEELSKWNRGIEHLCLRVGGAD